MWPLATTPFFFFSFFLFATHAGVVARVQHLKTYLSCYFVHQATLWYTLICSLPPSPLTDFLCKWISYVNAACSGFIAEPRQQTPVTRDKQEEKKNANLDTLKSVFFRERYFWEPEPAFPFFYHHSLFYTAYRLALHSLPPPFHCLVFSLSLCSYLLPLYFNFNFVLFFLLLFFHSLFISLSLVSSLRGSFGSERHFGARLRQYFTLIKRMVGTTMGAAWGYLFPASLPCFV